MANTSEYCFADLKVVMLGKNITGIRGAEYDTEQEKEPIYAGGNKPVAMGRGNKKFSASIEVLQSELEAIITSAGGDPTNIPPFDVIVSYVPTAGMPVKTDILVDCEFTSLKKALKQGDKFMPITLPLVLLDIKYNV